MKCSRKHVADLAEQVKSLDIKALTTRLLVRHMADQEEQHGGAGQWITSAAGAEPRNDESKNGKNVSSEKEMWTARKKAVPLEPLGNFSGFLHGFPEAHAAPLEPLGNFSGVFDGLRREGLLQGCAPGKRVAIASSFEFTPCNHEFDGWQRGCHR